MGARVRVRVVRAGAKRPRDSGVEIVALANSGYEADASELIVSATLAERLGFSAEAPRGGRLQTYQTPAGEFRAVRCPSAVRVQLILAGRTLRSRTATLVIVSTEREAILSAELASRLGIATIDPAEGIWALRDELTRLRRSEPAQYW